MEIVDLVYSVLKGLTVKRLPGNQEVRCTHLTAAIYR